MQSRRRDHAIWWGVWFICLLPLAFMGFWLATSQLTADPVEGGIHYLGEWGIRFLLIGLSLTPLRRVLAWSWVSPLRRMIGLYAVFYITLHVLAYVVVDQGLDFGVIWHDIVKRPYITVGVAGLLVLLPLAVTSANGMIRRLGGLRWKRLHRLVYLAPVLAVLHYFLLVKADTTWPLFYAAILCLLLACRVLPQARRPVRPASILARSH
jgi:methionine sulfoxide reductase heme-binding subunit